MNNIQIQQFNERLKKLGEFVKNHQGQYTESAIIDWVSDCVNVFHEIGVDSVIIRNFLDHFCSRTERIEAGESYITRHGQSFNINSFGPFREKFIPGGPVGFPYKTGDYELAGSFYYVKIAFSSAKSKLKANAEEKRIVPFWLIDHMVEHENIKHLTSSLELIEDKYEKKDASGLVAESVTLLGSVLNLDSELAGKEKLGGKLNSLIDDENKRNSFGASKDLVVALNSGRVVRNEKVIHKDAPLKYDLPFLIAASFAYLVLFFVECAILNGKIVSYESKQ